MIESIQKRNIEVARLTDWFAAQEDGNELSWQWIEHETGVKMGKRGRDYARRALRRARREYVALRGTGVRLSAPGNAMEIMGARFVRIDRSVRRAERSRTILAARHLDQMEPRQRERMLTLAAFFGTVRVFAQEAKQRLLDAPK